MFCLHPQEKFIISSTASKIPSLSKHIPTLTWRMGECKLHVFVLQIILIITDNGLKLLLANTNTCNHKLPELLYMTSYVEMKPVMWKIQFIKYIFVRRLHYYACECIKYVLTIHCTLDFCCSSNVLKLNTRLITKHIPTQYCNGNQHLYYLFFSFTIWIFCYVIIRHFKARELI